MLLHSLAGNAHSSSPHDGPGEAELLQVGPWILQQEHSQVVGDNESKLTDGKEGCFMAKSHLRDPKEPESRLTWPQDWIQVAAAPVSAAHVVCSS